MTDENENTDTSYATPLNDRWECCERTYAELRIYPGHIKPATVSDILGLEPTELVVIGEPIIGTSAIGKHNGWFLSSESFVDSKDLRAHLDWLLMMLQESVEGLRKLQNTIGVSIYVYCAWWSRCGECGPTLWPKQMRQLALLNLECSFSFIYTGGNES